MLEGQESSDFLNNLNSGDLCKVIVHQKDPDSRLCNRLIKLHDIVAGVQKGGLDVVPIG